MFAFVSCIVENGFFVIAGSPYYVSSIQLPEYFVLFFIFEQTLNSQTEWKNNRFN